jgi:hypothetical protein
MILLILIYGKLDILLIQLLKLSVKEKKINIMIFLPKKINIEILNM